MKRVRGFALLLLLTLGFGARPVLSESLALVSVGPSWPRVLLDHSTRRTAGNAQVEYGYMFERKIGVGVGAGLTWNTRIDQEEYEAGLWRDTLSRSSYMFPVFAFLLIDPASYLFIYPTLKAQIGYNSLAYSYSSMQDGQVIKNTELSGYYYGLFVRLSLDANYSFGEFASFLAGISYQWANTRSATGGSESYRKRDMSALGIHGGVRFLF